MLTSRVPSFSSHQISRSPPTVLTFWPSCHGLTGTRWASTNLRRLRWALSYPSPPSYALGPRAPYSWGSSHGFLGSFSTAELSGARTVVFCDEFSRREDADSVSLTNLGESRSGTGVQKAVEGRDVGLCACTYPAKRLMLRSRPITSESTTPPPVPAGGSAGDGSEGGGMAGPGPRLSMRGA